MKSVTDWRRRRRLGGRKDLTPRKGQKLLTLCVQLSSSGSGASTYTLDSGIGTFPLPDCSGGAAGRGLSKTRADHRSTSSPGRASRRARTLDRELTSQDESYMSHKQLGAPLQYGSVLEGRTSAGVLHEGDPKVAQRCPGW